MTRTSSAELQEAGLYDPTSPDAAGRLALLEWLVGRGFTIDQMVRAQRDGVLTRSATGTKQVQVTYALNAEGEKLVPLMESLCDWGSPHFGIKPNLPRPANR